jgi:hypothetical protein
MKRGEFYYNKYNQYASKVICVDTQKVTLITKDKVTDVVKLEHFDKNWVKINSVYAYFDLICNAFKSYKIKCEGSYYKGSISVVTSKNISSLTFTVSGNSLAVSPTGEFTFLLDLFKTDRITFLLEDAEDAIQTIASLV